MSAHAVLKMIAVGRVGLGLVALVLPEIPGRPWVGPRDAGSTGGRVLARALGARDLALGIGALGAMRSGSARNEADQEIAWAGMGVLADALDAAVTVAAFGLLPRRGRWQVLAAAGGSAVIGAFAIRAAQK